MDSLVNRCFLVYTALDEAGDVTVIDAQGQSLSYSIFKREFPYLRLTFPDKHFTRQTPLFQLNAFYRKDKQIIFTRTMISGRSLVRNSSPTPHFRLLPIFEIFEMKRELIEHQHHEPKFLALFRGLDFQHYPCQSGQSGNRPCVKKPEWYIPPTLRNINRMPKTWESVSSVLDWIVAYQSGIEKLLYFIWKCPNTHSGLSLCFSDDECRQNDVCTYYY